ncbi:MAG: amidohydrolase family protein [Patescibacteria group bacterium]
MLTIEGNIVNSETVSRKRIEIGNTGLITSVSEPIGKADFIFKDELIFPGFIDLHVHAREDASHTQDYKENFTTAGEAAVNGGVVAYADMPNNPVPPIDDASYDVKNNLAKNATEKTGVEILLYAGIGTNTKPLSKKVPYKVFMGHSVGDLFFKNYTELENVLENYRGQSVSFHCEDPEILEKYKNENTHEEQRPPEAEISAVDFALKLIEKYNLSGKICHCSTMEGVQKIIDAKKRGVSVTVEVAPHHLYFDETMLNESNRKMFQVNPPIRQTKENRLDLIQALKNGDIDYLATDHAPHTLEEKEKGISGMPHLDTYGLFTTWLMKEHNFLAQDIARVCSKNPGDFLNEFYLTPHPSPYKVEGKNAILKFGKIEAGYIGSLTILDMTKPIKIKKENLKTKCAWSPFENVEFPGSVVMTVIKGKIYR